MSIVLYILIVVLDALFLTELVNRYTINSGLQYTVVLVYFIILISIIVMIYRKYIIYKTSVFEKKIIYVILAAIFIVGAGSDLFNNHKYQASTIEITAMGEKNNNSNASEVWLTGIVTNDNPMDLTKIDLSNNWELKEGALLSSTNQPSTIKINLPAAKDIKISFMKHDWSGKVQVKDGTNIEIIDLFAAKSDNYVYQVKNNHSQPSLINIWDYFLAFIFMVSILYFLVGIVVIKPTFFSYVYISFYLMLSLMTNELGLDAFSKVVIVVLTICCGIVFSTLIRTGNWRNYFSGKVSKVFFVLITMYISFALTCNPVFYATGSFNFSIQNISIFILVSLWIIPCEFSFLYLMDNLTKQVRKREKLNSSIGIYKLWLLLFFVISSIWIVYLIAFNPANMSPDSIDQWQQALGITDITGWHPAFHTLLIKAIIHIYPSPSLIAIFQILFGAAVVSSFLVLFYKCGISRGYLILFAILFSIMPNNGVNIVTLWKDIPYTISLLWLSLVFVRLILIENNILKSHITFFHVLSLVGALSSVYLFRHNGVVPYVISILFLLLYSIRKRNVKIIVGIVISISIVLFVKTFLFSHFQVSPNPKGVSYVAPIHGIARVITHDGQISRTTNDYMLSIMPVDMWKKLYNPYSTDPYIFSDKSYDFINKLSAKSSTEILKMYLDTFVKNPLTIVYDRLTGVDLLWNITQPTEGFNSRYSNGVYENTLGIHRETNNITNIFTSVLERTSQRVIVDIFIWRGGLYTILFMLSVYYLFIRKKKMISYSIIIPFGGNFLSLLLSMTHQDYRYVYFEFFIIWFIIAAIILDNNQEQSKLVGKRIL